MRLFLLAIGWRTRDPYEREAARSVRSFLATLLFPLAMTFAAYAVLCFMFTLNVRIALLFSVTLVIVGAVPACFFPSDTSLKSGVEKTFTFHALQTRIVEMISAKFSIRQKIPVYLADLGGIQAGFITYALRPAIIVDFEIARRCGHVSLSGIVCHEVGHAVLPFGNELFSYITFFQRVYVDSFLNKAESKCWRDSKYPLFWRMIAKTVAKVSSYPCQRRREYACDAIAALLLHDVFPLVVGLKNVAEDDSRPVIESLLTHPPPHLRINALLDMNDAVSRTH